MFFCAEIRFALSPLYLLDFSMLAMKPVFGLSLAIFFVLELFGANAQTFDPNDFDDDLDKRSKVVKKDPLMHYVGLNLGATAIVDHYASMHIGVAYELKTVKGNHGIGFFFDYMFGPGTEIWFGFPISLHNPFKIEHLVLSAAPGIGITQSLNYKRKQSPDDVADPLLPYETRQNLLLKGSVSYVFPIVNAMNKETMRIQPYFDVFFIANYNTYLSLGTKILFDIYGK